MGVLWYACSSEVPGARGRPCAVGRPAVEGGATGARGPARPRLAARNLQFVYSQEPRFLLLADLLQTSFFHRNATIIVTSFVESVLHEKLWSQAASRLKYPSAS